MIPVDSVFFEGQVVGNCLVAKVGGEKLSSSSAWWDWFTHKDNILVGA